MAKDKVKAYCLLKKVDGEPDTFILANKSTDSVSFNEEVTNLAKYFNATIVGEVDIKQK